MISGTHMVHRMYIATIPYFPINMARNASATMDILYKCTIDEIEIKLRVISGYKLIMSIHKLGKNHNFGNSS